MNWKRASNQNFPAARLRVGDHHWYGLGVERNYAQAALYYRMCSEDNDPHASAQVIIWDGTTNQTICHGDDILFRLCLIWDTCIILVWDFLKIIISQNDSMMLPRRNLLKVCKSN